MKTLYLDCFAGISGDMTVGAFMDLGLELAVLEHELQKLHLEGYRLEAARVEKRGLAATQFKVILADADHEHLADAEFEDSHSHPPHEHPHEHEHEHSHAHGETEGHTHVHRSLSDILALIAGSELSKQVKDVVGMPGITGLKIPGLF